MKDIFELHPQLEKVFTTADGQAFYNIDDAKNHAKNLESKTVKTIDNENFIDVVDHEDVSDEAKALAEFEFDQEKTTLEVAADAPEPKPIVDKIAPKPVTKPNTKK